MLNEQFGFKEPISEWAVDSVFDATEYKQIGIVEFKWVKPENEQIIEYIITTEKSHVNEYDSTRDLAYINEIGETTYLYDGDGFDSTKKYFLYGKIDSKYKNLGSFKNSQGTKNITLDRVYCNSTKNIELYWETSEIDEYFKDYYITKKKGENGDFPSSAIIKKIENENHNSYAFSDPYTNEYYLYGERNDKDYYLGMFDKKSDTYFPCMYNLTLMHNNTTNINSFRWDNPYWDILYSINMTFYITNYSGEYFKDPDKINNQYYYGIADDFNYYNYKTYKTNYNHYDFEGDCPTDIYYLWGYFGNQFKKIGQFNVKTSEFKATSLTKKVYTDKGYTEFSWDIQQIDGSIDKYYITTEHLSSQRSKLAPQYYLTDILMTYKKDTYKKSIVDNKTYYFWIKKDDFYYDLGAFDSISQ